jgi:hypothetical protein
LTEFGFEFGTDFSQKQLIFLLISLQKVIEYLRIIKGLEPLFKFSENFRGIHEKSQKASKIH